MRLGTILWLLVGLAASLAQPAVADCSHISADQGMATPGTVGSSSQPSPKAPGPRIVTLELTLKNSGAVRAAEVLSGPATLRAPAIKAAGQKKYNRVPGLSPTILVRVTFAKQSDTVTDISRFSAGVLGCVSAPAMVRVSSDVMQTRLLARTDPVYPPVSQALHIQGTVVLRLHIDTAGNVSNLAPVSGPEFLVAAAIDAVKQWKFQPYLLNGTAIAVETTTSVKFALR